MITYTICSVGLINKVVCQVTLLQYIHCITICIFLFAAHDDWLAHDNWLGNTASINKCI